jgi:hypothetical protein
MTPAGTRVRIYYSPSAKQYRIRVSTVKDARLGELMYERQFYPTLKEAQTVVEGELVS